MDKGIALAACLALVALGGEVTAVTIVVIVCAVGASAAYDLMRTSHPAACDAVALTGLALSCLVPGAWHVMPLVSYDLPRGREPRSCLAAILALAVLWARGGVTPGASGILPGGWPVFAALAVACALTMSLSWRSRTATELRGELHRLQDDLSDKVIDLRRKNRELEDARAYESHAAALAERTRIAREIHDSVGHQLTRLVLQVEALKVVRRDDEDAVRELEEVSHGLNDALTSMRASVHALEDSALDLGTELNRLGTDSGIADVDVSCDVEVAPPAKVSRCLTAVTREALTNAARHAHAGHAHVLVRDLPGLWQLRVENDGDVPPSAEGLEDSGMGLRGMRDRVEELGGTLLVRSDGRRFSVFASIPRRSQA